METATVLIVEADLLVRHPLADYLRECGYRVVETANGTEARVALVEDRAIDVVLANVNAPEESGFLLAAWIRRHRPEIECILVGTVATACAKAADICEDGPARSSSYDHRLLHERIRRLLAARNRAQHPDEE